MKVLDVEMLNNLPQNIITCQTLKNFRKKLQQYYISMYDDN